MKKQIKKKVINMGVTEELKEGQRVQFDYRNVMDNPVDGIVMNDSHTHLQIRLLKRITLPIQTFEKGFERFFTKTNISNLEIL